MLMRKENEPSLMDGSKKISFRSENYPIIIGKERKIMRGFNKPYFGTVDTNFEYIMDIRNLTNELAKWAGFNGTAEYFAQEYNKDKGYMRKMICFDNFKLNPEYPLEV